MTVNSVVVFLFAADKNKATTYPNQLFKMNRCCN